MADTTIYPYGTNGQLPSSIGVINDLTTGGADKALSAEMGKELNEKKAEFTENDKVVVNQVFLDLYGVENEDYWIINDWWIATYNNGPLEAKAGRKLVLIKVRNSVVSLKGMDTGRYCPFWTTNTKPSLSNPTVDEDGNTISYTSGQCGWNSTGNCNNKSVSTTYALAQLGTIGTPFEVAFWPFLPDKTPQILYKSIQNGNNLPASSIEGVSRETIDFLKSNPVTGINQLDRTAILDGMMFSQDVNANISKDENHKILFQEIPANTSNILVMGIKGGWYRPCKLLASDLSTVAIKNATSNGSNGVHTYLFTNVSSSAKYIAFNIEGDDLGYDRDDILIMFNVNTLQVVSNNQQNAVSPYFDELYPHRNDNMLGLNVEYENDFPQNQFNLNNLLTFGSSRKFEFSVPSDCRYLYWNLPLSNYNRQNSENFVQYDENDNILAQVAPGAITDSLIEVRGNFPEEEALVRLEPGCTKISYTTTLGANDTNRSTAYLIEAGSKLYLLKDRIIPRRKPRVVSINGVHLNRNQKNPLEGMTIVCFGDSITDFGSSNSTIKGYPDYIQRKYDCACINYGRGSAHFIDYSGTDPTFDENPSTGSGDVKNVVSTQIRWCINEMTAEGITPDVAIINGGTNDCFGTVNYGTMTDALSTFPYTADEVHTNFFECVCYFVSKLQAAFPNIKIFLSTVTRCRGSVPSTGHNASVEEWNEKVYEIANALSLDVIDFWNCDIQQYPTDESNPWFYSDGLHLSTKGVKAMGEMAVSEISKAFPR